MIDYQGEIICIDPGLPLMHVLGKKYTMLILGVIGNNDTRKNFNDIYKSIPGASRRIIANRLSELLRMNVIKRVNGNVTYYELTDLGKKIRSGIVCFLKSLT
ncbi:winged helix-turn-helix transcriptional regulator [Picrophilus oshimae]|nr:helix-turn-helix domain-containing protein [Picrophilus oshimae]